LRAVASGKCLGLSQAVFRGAHEAVGEKVFDEGEQHFLTVANVTGR
jgi:hypothetical protein